MEATAIPSEAFKSECGRSFGTLSELLRHRKNCKRCLTIRADEAEKKKRKLARILSPRGRRGE